MEERTTLNSRFELMSESGIDFIKICETNESWLILHNNDFLMLYNSDGLPFFIGENKNEMFSLNKFNVSSDPVFETDSLLVGTISNKTIEYSSSNLTREAEIPYPWVEGESSYGVGVKFHGLAIKSFDVNNYYLYLSNGYVSYDRPDLFLKNSRVRKMIIRNLDSGIEDVFELSDTPQFQKIDLSKIANEKENNLEIEITDVYKGDLYKDTCINMMVTYDQRGDY